MTTTWKEVAARKQRERASRLPPQWQLPSTSGIGDARDVPRCCGILSTDELDMTENYDATGLLERLTAGQIKSEHVVRAFCKRAAIAQQLTNCLTEIFFEDALQRARELDQHLEQTGQPVGPLHGLPVSLKDTFKVRGYDASLGIASLCFKPAATNSALVDLLLSLGAVLYCKTNVPQTMMALDTHNNVFGRTLSPINKSLTAGGSSGGEGALIAMRGSILGVGTDVGGSIRIPSACNKLYGVKPSHGRLPFAGQEAGVHPGSAKLGIEATAGPIATTVRDCELLFRAVGNSGPETLDPGVVPGQIWDSNSPPHTIPKPFRIGIARTDGHVKPLPPIDTLLEQVAQTLQASKQAIEVIEIDVSSILSRAMKTANGIFSLDGNNDWLDLIEPTGEPLSPWLQSRIRRRPEKTTKDVRDLQASKLQLQQDFLDVWNESSGYWLPGTREARTSRRRLDAIITPVAPHPIPEIDRWNTANYTAAWNLLDLPAGVVPVRDFTEIDLQGEVPHSKPLNGWDKINRELWTNVDRNVYLGSPLSIQIITPRLTERRLLEAMALIDVALQPLRSGNARLTSKL